ncbi:hypothetical protein [Corynebacterium glutamicum]|uniref:hypothetical protein n=1 Tax=Corynebacterium glutamicum TaxID=1718 RepID=UPI0009421067|nr:hypothetical protein [Corynebacterium glutamicum]OKX83570.1 hypothetical protein AUO95_03775 [Corynebacterium glutamicum]
MIYNATTKIGSLLAVFIVLFLGAFAAASVFPDSIREVSALVAILGTISIYVLTRFFRSSEETRARRPLWLITTSPIVGFAVVVLFGAAAIQLVVWSNSVPFAMTATAVYLVFAALGRASAIHTMMHPAKR